MNLNVWEMVQITKSPRDLEKRSWSELCKGEGKARHTDSVCLRGFRHFPEDSVPFAGVGLFPFHSDTVI